MKKSPLRTLWLAAQAIAWFYVGLWIAAFALKIAAITIRAGWRLLLVLLLISPANAGEKRVAYASATVGVHVTLLRTVTVAERIAAAAVTVPTVPVAGVTVTRLPGVARQRDTVVVAWD